MRHLADFYHSTILPLSGRGCLTVLAWKSEIDDGGGSSKLRERYRSGKGDNLGLLAISGDQCRSLVNRVKQSDIRMHLSVAHRSVYVHAI